MCRIGCAWLSSFALVCLLVACGSTAAPPSESPLEAGVLDAALPDGAPPDAGEFDAGDSDAGDYDAGEFDAGDSDAGDSDAGDFDAGDFDAGEFDASTPDAAVPPPAPECPDLGLDPTAGTIHYVCDCGPSSAPGCVNGDDLAAGDAPERPWRTLGKARVAFGTLAAGDTVAFCRGGSFVVDAASGTRWNNANCRADHPCVVRDYAPPGAVGALERPIIEATSGGNAFALEDGGPSDHEEGYVILNLIVRGIGSGVGFFVYNDIDDVLLCNLSLEGFAIGIQVAGSNAAGPGSDAVNSRIVLRNSTILRNSEQGWLGGCESCAIEHCQFEDNGFRGGVFYHNIYLSSPNDLVTHGMRVVGNTLHGAAIVAGQCQGVSLVGHGKHDDLLIEGNVVTEDIGAAGQGCWGIAIDSGYGTAEAFQRVVVRGNTVSNVGNVGIGLSACQGCVVENNVVVQEQPFDTHAIAVPDRARGPEDLPMSDAIVRNNSIYFGASSGGIGVLLGEEGTGYRLVSNAVQYAGSGAAWRCFRLGPAATAFAADDYNLCSAPGAASTWVEGTGDLAAWRLATGFDLHSLVADPQFASLVGPAYDLRAGSSASPLVGNGAPLDSSPTDRDGLSRDATPDLGAYERR